ncbi:MAG: M55 family metallopeptidase [Cardiobacteriaceae bacterium]|nr:M55 family metallopeptidase [Cardiobacteriaceae bacterium]
MKVLISVDIEGVAGVVHPKQTRPGNAEYERARRWMAAEANAAAAGAFAGGAETVWIADAHGGFRNMAADDMDSRAVLVSGKPRADGMLASVIEEADALVLVGYHSKAGGQGVLAHTINGFAFADIAVNGVSLGEAGLYGLLAGELGVPLVFASGDQHFIAENRAFFPDVHWLQSKTALGDYAAANLSPAALCDALQRGVEAAVRAAVRKKPALFVMDAPYRCTVRANNPALADLFALLPDSERVDGTTVAFTETSMRRVMRVLNLFSAASAALRG